MLWLTISRAACLLGLPDAIVVEMALKGRLPARLRGSAIVVSKAAVERIVATRDAAREADPVGLARVRGNRRLLEESAAP